ncbi:MAG: GNAT family N-acetyltransferase [Acetobacter sp.]|nr:GNAT family N-acetyltransferase [Acetobacter sp.]
MAEEFVIRLAEPRDIKTVFDLSNDDTVRTMSIHPEKIEWENHVKWFENKINDADVVFYVMETAGELVGYVHLDRERTDWVVTIHLKKDFRGKGLGKKLLKYAVDGNVDKSMVSCVKNENEASKKLFLSQNFIFRDFIEENGILLSRFVHSPLKQKSVIAVSNALYNGTSLFDKENICYLTSKADLTIENLERINPKYVFFPHWSYIIPAKIYENFDCVIFHMTDLPFGRGGSPLQNLIARKIYKTKISAIKCVKTLDGGDVYLKRDFDISESSASVLYRKAGKMISEMIDEIVRTSPIPIPQMGEIVEFKRRTPEESDIKNLQDLRSVYDYIRMLDADGYPHAFLKNGKIRFEFQNAEMDGDEISATVKIRRVEK